jgi:hypothetical protein
LYGSNETLVQSEMRDAADARRERTGADIADLEYFSTRI